MNAKSTEVTSYSSYEQPQEWSQLIENYEQIIMEKDKQKSTIISFIEIMQRNLTIKPKKGTLTDHEWAKLMWRWAFKLVSKDIQLTKNAMILRKVKTFVDFSKSQEEEDRSSDESSIDSEERFLKIEKTVTKIKFNRQSMHRKPIKEPPHDEVPKPQSVSH